MVKAYISRGDVYMQMGRYPDALQDYNKAVELDSVSMDAHYSRGYLKIKLKDYSGALRDLNRAMERSLGTNNGKIYYFRGLAKYFLGHDQTGCIDFAKAKELGFEQADESIEQYCH
jgi:tetratricopeptide (TPR) repeat protein